MMLSIIPSAFFANAVLLVPTVTAITAGATGLKGQTYEVSGAPGEVAAGTTVQIYWDDTTTAWDGTKGLLNSTTAKADGSYKVRFKVPEAKKGNHYIWVKAVTTNELKSSAAFAVNTKVSLSATSGLPGDKITVTAYGFGGSKDIRLVFLDSTEAAFPGWTSAAGTAATLSGDGTTKTFSGTVTDKFIKPGTFTVTPPVLVPSDAMVDSGLGTLSSVAGGTGTINYITGEYSVTFKTAPAVGVNNIAIAYTVYPTTLGLVYPLNQGSTNSIGTYSATLTVPAGAIAGADTVAAVDAVGNEGEKTFNIGSVIAASTTSTTVGSIVTIQGRGFGVGKVIGLVNLPTIIRTGMAATNCAINDLPVGGVVVDAQGRFRMDIIIPQGNDENDDYTITVKTDDGLNTATITDFEITALAEVSVTPSYGPQGFSIAVSGVHYTKITDTVITVDLVTTAGAFLINIGTVKTLFDGTFSKTFSVPAWIDGSYKIKAYKTTQNIADTVGFRIGSMYIHLSATEGPAGKAVTITGSGFSASKTWNATIGSKTLLSTSAAGAVAVTGLINTLAYIPQMAPGTYTVTIWDIDADIKLTASFTVTYNTQITLTPSTAPNGFNVTVAGKGFKYIAAAPTFVVYNKTSTGATDKSWIFAGASAFNQNYAPIGTAQVNTTGIIRAYWVVPASAVLSKGTYYLNVTDASGDYMAQATFVVGSKHITATPRKTSFAIGETISFTLEHTFGLVTSYLKIYDPSGNLVFSGDALATWVSSGDWKIAPYSSQNAGGNPMTIRDDAPTGTWSWKWYDPVAKANVATGTFTVTTSAASETDTKIAALATQITALQGAVTTAISGAQTAATQASTDAKAATTAATQASTDAKAATTAATAAGTAATAAGTAATAAGTKADAATAAANIAATAAKSAADAASGLTTLVYAAIGASLIAALAAIVALMQISRKIA
jgi:hypothetical protein